MPSAAREEELAAWLRAQPVVLVDFHAHWCAPCRLLSPLVERIAAKYAGRLPVARVDVDGFPAAAARYRVASLPTLLLLRHGEPAARLTGLPAPEELVAWLTAHVGP